MMHLLSLQLTCPTHQAAELTRNEEEAPHTLNEDAIGQSSILAARGDAEEHTVWQNAVEGRLSSTTGELDDVQDPEKQAQEAVQELDVEHVAG